MWECFACTHIYALRVCLVLPETTVTAGFKPSITWVLGIKHGSSGGAPMLSAPELPLQPPSRL